MSLGVGVWPTARGIESGSTRPIEVHRKCRTIYVVTNLLQIS